MANIFINSLNASLGGGKNILDNYISQLSKNKSSHNYFILTPDYEKYSSFSSENIRIIKINGIYKNQFFFLFLYFYKFPQILKNLNIDLTINFGDIIIPSKSPQIYYFDWAYAVYDSESIWREMDLKNYLIRKTKVHLIRRYIQDVNLIFAQTEDIKDRLITKLNSHNVRVLPTPIGLDLSTKNIKKYFKLPKNRILFLYPASFSVHKNFNIILKVGKLIDSKDLPFTVVLTLKQNDDSLFFHQIKNIKSIINVSTVSLDNMPSLYNQCDALFFPSLLESYGLPLVEAMAFEKPILVSDLDFAHAVCGKAAFYFDPYSPNSIIEVMNSYNINLEKLKKKIKVGKEIVDSIPEWTEVFLIFEKEINFILNK